MERAQRIRQSNFELMRIISIFMIVVWHVILSGVGLKQVDGILALFFDIIRAVFVVHVNSFILVTGYFQCTSSFKLRKLLNLLATSWFYRIISLLIVLMLSLSTYTNLEILKNGFILPLDHEHWFIHYYVLLYLISPFLNKYINRVNQKELKITVLVLIFINSILPYLSNQGFFTVNFGFSLYHFITLYFIGSYLRKYPLHKSYHFKSMSIKKFRILLIFIFFSCSFVSLAVQYFGKYICIMGNGFGSIINEVGSVLQLHAGAYDFPLTILQSCAYLLLFIIISFKSKFINYISSLMIGVYLIHESEVIKPYIYQLWPFDIKLHSNLYILLQIFTFALFIFIGCILIEIIRKILLKILKFIIFKLKNKFVVN